jgi:arabinose-5-phosphate isomerase
MTLVVDDTGKTLGIVTDGDIRRVLTREQDIQHLKVQDIYTPNPKSISKTALAAEALALMEQHQITVLPVNTANGHSEGIVHLHDLLKTGI